MAGPVWLFDSNRFATKIKCASTSDSENVEWKSNPCRSCPRCHYVIDNSDVIQEWPGLPRGVKFDPTDQEIIQHLLAQSGKGDEKPHPFISEFITTVDEEDGICYTHPSNLPGVKQDGSASHFFHRSIKAYNTGTRKRRRIHSDDKGDVRWHKTGRTKAVIVNDVQKGCKKIMVLYVSTTKGGKPEKTNWVMHQYHLGVQEDEDDGEFVISKVFLQQQHVKQNDNSGRNVPDTTDDLVVKLDPVTPKPVTPDHQREENQYNLIEEPLLPCLDSVAQDDGMECADEVKLPEASRSSDNDNDADETAADQGLGPDNNGIGSEETIYLVDSQQLMAGLQLCADFFQSQSPTRDENPGDVEKKRSILSEYAQLGSEVLKKDLEECHNFVPDAASVDLDTQPEVGLSQLDFCSQESYSAWGGNKIDDST